MNANTFLYGSTTNEDREYDLMEQIEQDTASEVNVEALSRRRRRSVGEVNVGAPSQRQRRSVGIRNRKKTSRCWLSFEKLEVNADGSQYAQCKKCAAMYKCGPDIGTNTMLRHHDICFASADATSPQSATRSSKFQYETFSRLLIESIVKHDLPFRFAEYDGIRAVFQYISPALKLPCRNTVKSHVLKLFQEEKSKLQSLLSSVKGRMCLTSDLWTSQATDGYLTLTAHFIDEEWRLQKKILNFCHMPPPHNGVSLADKIKSLITEWGIERKLFSITVDNASANDVFVEKLKMQLNFRGLLLMDGRFFHVRCCAHILNLIVQRGLQVIDPSVIKIRECIKYIKGSSSRKHKFFECVRQVGLGASKRGLRQDVPTRWNSTYIMLDSALFYRRALMQMGLAESDFDCCPDFDEWDKIEKITKFLGYFYEVTCLFSGTQYPTSNLFFPKIFHLHYSIREAMADPDPFMKQMGEFMNEKFEKYWSEYSLILAIAVVMDPRYKMKAVEWGYKKLYGENSLQFKLVSDTLFSMFDEYVENCSNPNISSNVRSEISSQAEGEDILFEDFDNSYGSGSNSSFKSELQKYLDEIKKDRREDLDVLSWWKDKQFQYPTLFHLARDVLTIPVSTVASESAFSIGGRVLDQYRSSMLPGTFQALLCTRDWIFGQKDECSVNDLTEDIFNLTLENSSSS